MTVLKYSYKLVAVLVATTFLYCLLSVTASAQWTSPLPLSGYAWSANVGWISFSGANYGVDIDNVSKDLSGYAWSQHIGWIQFGGLSGCPSGSCAANLNTTNNQLTGWARALNYGSGWDGWISLSCQNSGGCGTSNYAPTTVSTGFSSSYAWGSDVVGWINFSLVELTAPCSTGNSCTASYDGYTATTMWCEPDVAVTCNTSAAEVCTNAAPTCSMVVIPGDLAVTPALVRTGGTVEIIQSGVSGTDSCRVESNDGSNYAGTTNDTAVTSNPLTFKTNIFTLYCIPAGGGPDIEVDSETVQIIPIIYEI